MKFCRLSLLLGPIVVVAGCSSIMPPRPDPTQYFVLYPVSASTAASTASTANLSIGIGPIGFPGYLERPEVVMRATSTRLIVSDDKRWAEPVDRDFQGVLGQNLSQILGTGNITYYPWYADTHIDYQVQVQVERFDAGSDGRSWLSAAWIIKDGRDGHELASGQSLASTVVKGDDAAGTEALSQNLGELSRQIAGRIARLNVIARPSPPPASNAS